MVVTLLNTCRCAICRSHTLAVGTILLMTSLLWCSSKLNEPGNSVQSTFVCHVVSTWWLTWSDAVVLNSNPHISRKNVTICLCSSTTDLYWECSQTSQPALTYFTKTEALICRFLYFFLFCLHCKNFLSVKIYIYVLTYTVQYCLCVLWRGATASSWTEQFAFCYGNYLCSTKCCSLPAG